MYPLWPPMLFLLEQCGIIDINMYSIRLHDHISPVCGNLKLFLKLLASLNRKQLFFLLVLLTITINRGNKAVFIYLQLTTVYQRERGLAHFMAATGTLGTSGGNSSWWMSCHRICRYFGHPCCLPAPTTTTHCSSEAQVTCMTYHLQWWYYSRPPTAAKSRVGALGWSE